MAKTPHLLEARQRLRALGDQLYFQAFADEVFQAHLASLLPTQPNAFTPAVFPTSTWAPRINVRLADLERLRQPALLLSAGALYTSAYEMLESYMNQTSRLLARCGLTGRAPTPGLIPEDHFAASIVDAGGSAPEREIIETVKYLRLRRNQVAHLREEPTSELAALVRHRGTHLMRYWQPTGAMDFSAQPSHIPDVHQTVGLLKYVRICVEELDPSAASALDVEKVIRSTDGDVVASRSDLRHSSMVSARAAHVETLVAMLYDLSHPDVESVIK